MKTFLILSSLLFVAQAALAKPLSLHIESKCETCTPTNRDKLAAALRDNLQDFGIVEAESSFKSPRLIVFAIQADSIWFLSQVLQSPKGTTVNVTREEFKGGFKDILAWGADSAVVHAKREIEAAIKRANEESAKAESKVSVPAKAEPSKVEKTKK